MSVADEIRKLTQLRNEGTLTEAEFTAAKTRVLGGQTVGAVAQARPQSKSKFFDPRANAKGAIRIVVVLGVLVLGFWVFMDAKGGISPVAGTMSAIRSPTVIVDEEFFVDAGGAQMRSFTLPSARPVRVEVTGMGDTAKGFSVYLIKSSEWENFKAGRKFLHLPSFEGLKVRNMTKTETLPAGSYAVVVQNSENLLKRMSAHAKITVDP